MLSRNYWKICIEFALVFSARRNRMSAFTIAHYSLSRECAHSIALRTENQCNFNADFSVNFFDNFLVFSQWPLIFYISNIHTSLYRFLLKFFNFGIYTSLPFLVSKIYNMQSVHVYFKYSYIFVHLLQVWKSNRGVRRSWGSCARRPVNR